VKKVPPFLPTDYASIKMIDSEALTRVDKIFNAALKRSPDDRGAFLDSACGDDGELLSEVESLLAAASEMGENFLEEPILSLDDAPEELDEDSFVGPYRILREIGKGGMGKVYLATRDDEVFQQEVAVKILKRGLDTEEIVGRFHHERQLLARLDHPHIVRILDGGTTDDGLPYFVMDYVEGDRVDRYCEDRKLSVKARLELFREVCSAVGFAHQNLVVHRDLKPQNILVDGRGESKLLDFGIAKLLDPDQEPLTQVGTQPMTTGYAAPEQIENGPITTATDVYSLGRLLCELLTGTHPYGALLPEESLCQRILEREADPPSRIAGCSHLAGDLDSIVLKALEKDPRCRYSSAEQFSEDVGHYLEGLPVRARQGTAPYRLGKFVRRHRLGVAVVAAVLVGILGFGVSMKVLRDQAVLERGRAKAVTQYLVKVFQNSDPDVSEGAEITARQLLDDSVKTIDEELEGEPETQATLKDAMGQAYLGLALYDQAVPLLEESLKLRRESPHTRPEELAASLFNLAIALRAKDRDDEAIRLAREALEILGRGGGDDPDLARGLNNHALFLKGRGDVSFAEELYRASLAMKIRLLGDGHEDVARGKHNLAAVLRAQGKYDEAEKLYRESLTLKGELYGKASPEAAMTLNSLALLLKDRDDLEAAERMLREVLEIRRRVYGSEHDRVGKTLINLGSVLRLRESYDEAETRYDEAMQIFSPSGKESSNVANVLRHQALLRLAQGRAEEAEDAARRALEVYRRVKPEGHWRIAEAESVLGACLLVLGGDEEGVPLLRRGYQTLRAAKGDAARQTREALERFQRAAPETR
jgi:tetratricopeptide (TPR) repeat protein